MASAAIRSKVAVLLLIYFVFLLPLCFCVCLVLVLWLILFVSEKGELGLLYFNDILYSCCSVRVSILCLFLVVLCVWGLWSSHFLIILTIISEKSRKLNNGYIIRFVWPSSRCWDYLWYWYDTWTVSGFFLICSVLNYFIYVSRDFCCHGQQLNCLMDRTCQLYP